MSVPTDVLAQLGVELDLEDGDLITDAIVLIKVSTAEGGTSLISRTSAGLDFVTYAGMLTLASDTPGQCGCDE